MSMTLATLETKHSRDVPLLLRTQICRERKLTDSDCVSYTLLFT